MSPQQTIAHYRITTKLGEGGMGEVWRATDTKLNRDVAIKILPDTFAADPDRLARFTREAQVLAALNHPNIAAIYDTVGVGHARPALVMELVEGETLSGPLPLDTALDYARQIADALEAAHEKGIVHRDLKPANIKITPEGRVKVLDFGLAKAMSGDVAAADSANSPTLTMRATQMGVILGTAAYMAPEQAKGKPVDKRADIWAFGVVLYEMITGQRLFEGEDLTETLASVVKDKPDLSPVPMHVRGLVERCLEKDPRKRLRDIGDMRLLLAVPALVSPRAAPPSAKLSRIAAAVLAAALGIALWAPWRAKQPAESALVRLDVDLGADVSLPALAPSGTNVVLSPDGTRLAYSSGTPPRLFIRRLDQPSATEILGTEGSELPFFSPDGEWVAFRTGDKLNKVSVEGGAVVVAANAGTSDYAGACWGEDGSIVFSEAVGRGLVSIPAAGGALKTLVPLAGGEFALALPRMLPGDKAILFAQVTAFDPDKINTQVLRLANSRRTTLVRGGSSPRYVAAEGSSGYLIYVNKETLFAIPFDLDSLQTRGTAVAVLNDVAYDPWVGTGQFDFSPAPLGHGTLVYRRSRGSSSQLVTLTWADPGGGREPLRAHPDAYHSMRISPDGKKVALTIMAGDRAGLWVYDLSRNTMTRLSFSEGVYDAPLWSPDGRYLVFSAFGAGIMQARADGAGRPQLLVDSKTIVDPAAFTPDGKVLAYNEIMGGNARIWTVPLEDTGGQWKAGKAEPFQEGGFRWADGISPDGRWLAYTSSESGKPEVYVRAFPPLSGQGGKWQISNGGGRESFWTRNGHDLLYRSAGRIMAVRYSAQGDTFAAETPRVWLGHLGGTTWTLAPDDKRALVLAPLESAEASKPEHEVVFLQNFLDELRRRLPAGK